MSFFDEEVAAELDKARAKHPEGICSLAEGYAVILEEVDELWDEVRKKPKKRKDPDVLTELIQIGAMAQRVAEDLGLAEI
jgi:hypothetical protein